MCCPTAETKTEPLKRSSALVEALLYYKNQQKGVTTTEKLKHNRNNENDARCKTAMGYFTVETHKLMMLREKTELQEERASKLNQHHLT